MRLDKKKYLLKKKLLDIGEFDERNIAEWEEA